MIYHYEERIRRLIGALKEIADGTYGPLTVTGFAKQTIETDKKIAAQYKRDVRGESGDD